MIVSSSEGKSDVADNANTAVDSTASNMERFINTSLFSSPVTFSSSIWSPSAPASSGAWGRDPSWDAFSKVGWTPMPLKSADVVSDSLLASMNQMNIGSQRPFLPTCLDSPKNALTMWYGQHYKNFLQFKTNDCFTTWDDGGKPHEVKFTAVFTCPVSGEHFASGKYGKERDVHVVVKDEQTHVDVYWFYKKQHAQHAAAARALDCLSFREGKGLRSLSYGLCVDDPYLSKEDAPPLPTSAPILLLESKAEALLNKQIQMEDTMADATGDEVTEGRDTYRQSRVLPAETENKECKA